jgi:hypothetical protein
MDSSTSSRLANIIANLSSAVVFNGQFKKSGDVYQQVDKVLFGHRIANIVVAGSEMRMIFKIHYSEVLGKLLYTKFLNNPNPSMQMIDDYFLETCNLAAGRIKHGFGDEGTNLGISIPIKTKAFDDLFFNLKTDGEYSSEWHWDVSFEDITVHFSVFTELLNLEMKIDESLEQVQEVEELEFF